MDPEQTFLRVHARAYGVLSRLLTPRIRTALEYFYLVVAISLFCLLVVMHTNFVSQPGCSGELSEVETIDTQIVQIKITPNGPWAQMAADRTDMDTPKQGAPNENFQIPDVGGDGLTSLAAKFWHYWIGSGAWRSKLIVKSWKDDKAFIELQMESSADSSGSKPVMDGTDVRVPTAIPCNGFPISTKESFKFAVINFWSKWCMQFSSFLATAKQSFGNIGQLRSVAGWEMLSDFPKWLHSFRFGRIGLSIVQWLEKRSNTFEPTYLYTVEKGYFMLPEGARAKHNIHTTNISISAHHSCFGNRWQRLLINGFIGYDTILMNSLLNPSASGQGYLYNFLTKEFYDLRYVHKSDEDSLRSLTGKAVDYFVAKCGVLIMSLIVFFTTTMSVSFTLRETQSRMLKFTVQLQHHARHHLPTFQLIFVHVIESLVFVPIMIGILFFLFEFYDDQLLAFMVLTLVWLCELFTMISVRTPLSMQYFPHFFLLYFLMFHIYFFSYTYGFSYLAFYTTAAFMQHLVLYFWNRFEVPALERFMQHRFQLQQQAGVHITSSAILTSTLHIARVNMRNPNLVNELGPGPAPDQARPNSVEGAQITGPTGPAATDTLDVTSSPPQLPESDPQQSGTPNSSPQNSFGSLLLWILGGGSGDGLVSFFSMFRDSRAQGQGYGGPQHEIHRPPVQNSWWRRS